MSRHAYVPARVTLIAIAFLASMGIAEGASVERDRTGFAIEHVTILPMTKGGAPIEDGTVVVRSGRVVKIGHSGRVQVPRGLMRLSGEGKWLMPGLADMHVHTLNRGYGRELPGGKPFPVDYMRTQDVMLPFITNGVMQVLEMSALPEMLEQISEIENGRGAWPSSASAPAAARIHSSIANSRAASSCPFPKTDR